jgi:uncharacterized protein (TIGR02246 family)
MSQEAIMKRYLGLISLLVLAATVHTIPSTAFGVSQDEASVRAIPQKITEAWSNGQEDGIAAVYADDGTLVAGHGIVLQGRAQIARYHDEIFANAFKATRLTVKITSVRFLDQDVAIMQTEGGILWPGETELAHGNHGVQSFVVVKQDGAWQVVLFQNTRILPVVSADQVAQAADFIAMLAVFSWIPLPAEWIEQLLGRLLASLHGTNEFRTCSGADVCPSCSAHVACYRHPHYLR